LFSVLEAAAAAGTTKRRVWCKNRRSRCSRCSGTWAACSADPSCESVPGNGGGPAHNSCASAYTARHTTKKLDALS